MNKKAFLGQAWRHTLLLIVCAVSVVPILWIFMNSLKTSGEIMKNTLKFPTVLHFENYARAWNEGGLGHYMFNSLVISGVSTALTLVSVTLAAYAFARMEFRGKSLLFVLVVAGMSIPASMKLAPLMTFMNWLGLYDTRLGLILVYSSGVSFGILMMRSFFRTFPRELEEAAEIDGANRFQTLWHVLMPLMAAPLGTLTVFVFTGNWKEFMLAFLLTASNAVKPLSVGLKVFQAKNGTDYAMSFTGVVISAIPMILLYIFFQRSFINGVTAGSLK